MYDMGLFGKKKEKSEYSVVAQYYAGELQGFSQDDIVKLTVNDEVLILENPMHSKPPLKVTLDKSRVLGADRFDREEEYMLKHHGDKERDSKPSALLSALGGKSLEERTFLVIRYESKDGEAKQMTFYTKALEAVKLWSFRDKLINKKAVEDYSI